MKEELWEEDFEEYDGIDIDSLNEGDQVCIHIESLNDYEPYKRIREINCKIKKVTDNDVTFLYTHKHYNMVSTLPRNGIIKITK